MRGLAVCCVAVALSTLTGACQKSDDKDAPLDEPSLLELDLTQQFGERDESFLSEHRPSLSAAVERVKELSGESQARGLFVRLGPLSGHWSDVDEWSQVFESVRAKKKPVHCAFEVLDNAGYALAAHCDRLSMTPAGTLDLVGLGAQVLHGKQLLDSMGVKAELLQMGRYKGAAEPFTLDTMSEPLRESIDGLLDDLDTQFRAHLATRPSLKAVDLQKLLDQGPFHGEAARSATLVDALAYDDEARQKAKLQAEARAVHEVFPRHREESISLLKLIEALSEEHKNPLKNRDRIVLATLVGEIVDGDRMSQDRAASEPFVAAMRGFGDDKHVKAVVLRIESPGGSALASDRMWHAVRRLAGRKPVIISMGDMAASGGYYVACAGTHVIASESSIVGSIGVVGGKIVFAGLADKVGIHADTLKRAEHATWLSPLAPFSPAERGQLEDLLRNTYDRFLERVATGRKRTVAQIEQAAEGRVMGGIRAKRLGLVDELGGVSRALAVARERAKVGRDAPIETWPSTDDPLSALSSALMQSQADTPEMRSLRQLSTLSEELPLKGFLTDLAPGRPAAVFPAHLSVR